MSIGKPIRQECIQKLLDAIFASSNVTVYETYSRPSKDLRVFASADELLKYMEELIAAKDNLLYLSLHYEAAKGFVYKKTIQFQDKKSERHKTKTSVEGWGLIQFQLWLNESITCDIGVNSEKRAQAWAENYPELQSPSLWHWKEVAKQSRRLKRVLKTCLNAQT